MLSYTRILSKSVRGLDRDNLYDDPFQQAEYAYSLIKSEVILDDNQECYDNSCS